MKKKDKDFSASIEEISKKILALQTYLKSLSEKDSISEEDMIKLDRVFNSINRIRNIAKESRPEEDQLKKIISDFIFGVLGDKKSRSKKIHMIEDLLQDLTDSTIENLIKRYVNGEDTNHISIDQIVKEGGILNVNLDQELNGISGEDIKKIYNSDSLVGGGLQQRGKGETLFSLAFNSVKNDEAGGDVRSLDTNKVIEIKSSNSAGITPKSGPPLALGFEELLKIGGDLFDLDELKRKRIQKISTESLISKIKEGGENSRKFLAEMSRISGIKNPDPEDIIPIFLLLQLDYYSKDLKEFQTFCVFVEKNNTPVNILIIDSNKGTFLSRKNIDSVKESRISPKVTSSDRAEIYIYNKKERKKSEKH